MSADSHKLYEQGKIEGLTRFDVGGSKGFLSLTQEEALKVWMCATLLRSTRQISAWIQQ